MAIVPTGSPAWVRNADHTIYGGDTNKTNWHSQGVTNARTDVGAEAFVRLAEDLSAVVRTAAFCELTITCNDTVPGPPTIVAVNQMTGVTLTSYVGNSPPAGFPSGARNGNGDVTITWAASYTDDYGVSGNVNIAHVLLSSIGSTAAMPVYQRADLDINGLYESVRVRVFNTAAAAIPDASFSMSVLTGPG